MLHVESLILVSKISLTEYLLFCYCKNLNSEPDCTGQFNTPHCLCMNITSGLCFHRTQGIYIVFKQMYSCLGFSRVYSITSHKNLINVGPGLSVQNHKNYWTSFLYVPDTESISITSMAAMSCFSSRPKTYLILFILSLYDSPDEKLHVFFSFNAAEPR